MRLLAVVIFSLNLIACGAETAATAVVTTKMQAEEAQRAKEQMQEVQKQLNDATALSQARMEEAERAAAGNSQ
jgi:hypothetical protein